MTGIGLQEKWKKTAYFGTLLFMCAFVPSLNLPSPSSVEEKKCKNEEYLTEKGICCNKCFPGYKLKQVCNAEQHRSDCEECGEGEYNDQKNYHKNCRSCKKCKENEEEASSCKPDRNTVCRCKEGFFEERINSDTHECVECTSCLPGERQTVNCTHEHDRVCDCDKGFYRNDNKCLLCKNCLTGCENLCRPALGVKGTSSPETFPMVWTIVLVLAVVAALSFLSMAVVIYKYRKKYYKKRFRGSSSLHESPVSVDSNIYIEMLNHKEEPTSNKCNKAVPQALLSEEESANLPDCVPLEIKIPELIYTVLELVPVSLVKQLVRSLGVTDVEIEWAEADHRSCREAHYQMLRLWAERGCQMGEKGGQGGILYRPRLQELLDGLNKMHLGKAVGELETKYSTQ